MDRGIYSAATGGVLGEKTLQVVAHNLANVSTVGFKAERLVSKQQEFQDTLAGVLSSTPQRAKGDHDRVPGVVNLATKTDFTAGPISHTGNPLNAALAEENQFFVVSTPQGEMYTRAGNFTTDVNGNLITMDGMEVQGEGGPITVSEGSARITSNGTVMVNDRVIGKLRVAQIDDLTQLKRQEGVRFSLEGGAANQAQNVQVVPESVEMPNVSVIQAMVDMVAAQRSFEAYTKSVRTIDELNERALRNTRVVTG